MFIRILFVLSLLGAFQGVAKKLEIDSFSDLSNIILTADHDDLVLFDIDNVLLVSTPEYSFTSPIRISLKQSLRKKYSKNELKFIFSDLWRKRKVEFINPQMPELLKNLAQKNIPTTALTNWWTEKYGTIERMEDIRIKDLNQLVISFKATSPFKKDQSFPNLKTKYGGTPMIKDGILIGALGDKGEVLEKALQSNHLRFKKIYFIDDRIQNVDDVEKACQRLGLEYIGIHYIEAKKRPIPKLDPKKEKKRFKILEEKHVWLLDSDL